MISPKDLTGKRFGNWIVLEYAGKSRWLCRCDCGTIRDVKGANLINHSSTSCGCLRLKNCLKSVTSHGQSQTKLYKVWNSMRQRCENPNLKCYKNYGGRGISVCKEWLVFDNFYNWAMKNDYDTSKKLTIERINNNGNYEPSNCEWATYKKQSYNRRTFNSSGIRGISWSKRRSCWVCQIWFEGKSYYVGQFKDLDEAVEAMNKKREEIIKL